MKRIISLFLVATVLFILPAISLSEGFDLSSLSFDDLKALEKQIIKEMVSRPEFKEVTVPLGVYKVGEDIPAGKWTITGFDGAGKVTWGKGLDEYGVEIPYNQKIAEFTHWNDGDKIDWELVEGTYIVVIISSVKFSPYIPKSLGF